MRFHPIAEVFPLMSEDEFARLREDVRAHGLRESIWLYEGQIIDGRNRYKACRQTDTEPHYREWVGDMQSLTAFVISMNLHRRHLSESQRAMVALKLTNLERGNPKFSNSANLQNSVSQSVAAEMLNVSTRTVAAAAKIKDIGVQELVEAVETGEVSIAAAALLTELPPEEQKEIVALGGEKMQKRASKIRLRKVQKLIKKNRKACIVCNLHIGVTDENFIEHMTALAKRAPKFSRLVWSLIEEMETLSDVEEAHSEYALIFTGMDRGMNEFNQLRQFTGIPKERLQHLLRLLLETGDVSHDQQGGKQEKARGQRKQLYFRTEQSLNWHERG